MAGPGGAGEQRQPAKRAYLGRNRQLLAVGVVLMLGLAIVAATVGQVAHRPKGGFGAAAQNAPGASTSRTSTAPYPVGLRVLRLIDHSRQITLPDGSSEPRPLVTYVRYPAATPTAGHDESGAPPQTAAGPFPLVVFGHGFALTPSRYGALLDAWARAGYVVAAPVFPLENANAPGGPDESDLTQQPRDVRFVISQLLAAGAAARGAFRHLIDPTRVAVAGHSDGGDTALAVAYNRYSRDPRVKASVILSGAEIPGLNGFSFPLGSPPLLATQGTNDTVNSPDSTYSFFTLARRPKFLLTLLGASHLMPYSSSGPQLRVVERVTIAFLDRYLKARSLSSQQLAALGTVPGISSLQSRP